MLSTPNEKLCAYQTTYTNIMHNENSITDIFSWVKESEQNDVWIQCHRKSWMCNHSGYKEQVFVTRSRINLEQ